MTRTLVSNYGTGGDARNRGTRTLDQPAPTLTSKADRNKWDGGERERESMSATEAAALQGFPSAVKNMGAGMVERYGSRPGRPPEEPAFTIRASAGGGEPGGFKWSNGEKMTAEQAAEFQSFPTGWGFTDRPAVAVGNAVGRGLIGGSGAKATVVKAIEDGSFTPSTHGKDDSYAEQTRITPEEAGALQSFPTGAILRNGNQANSAKRDPSTPAPTMHFGQRSNKVEWMDPALADDPTASGERVTPGQASAFQSFPTSRPAYEPEAAVPGDTSWCERRPSPTIVGSFAPDVVAAPGYRKAGDGPRQSQPGSIRVSQEQAAVLQSFPIEPAFVWKGAKTKQFLMIGNAIPCLLATHILESLVSGSQEVAKTYELSNLREDPFSRPEVS